MCVGQYGRIFSGVSLPNTGDPLSLDLLKNLNRRVASRSMTLHIFLYVKTKLFEEVQGSGFMLTSKCPIVSRAGLGRSMLSLRLKSN